MNTERIKELRALAEKATPGPWRGLGSFLDLGNGSSATPSHLGVHTIADGPGKGNGVCVLDNGDQGQADAVFIAEARTALPDALDAIERVRALPQFNDPEIRNHKCDDECYTSCQIGERWIVEAVLAAFEGKT